MNQDRLLRDDELKQECLTIISLQEYGTTPSNLSGEQLAKIGFASVDLYQFINTQKRLYAESVINRIDTAYKYSSLETDFTPYDAGKNRGLAIAVALLEGNEYQVIEDSAEQRARIK